MSRIPFRFGPQYLASGSAANILSPGTATGGVLPTINASGGTFATSQYVNLCIVITHLHIINTAATPIFLTLYLGASGGSAGGTEFAWGGTLIAANDYDDFYTETPIYVGEFLTGIASASTSMTIEGAGYLRFHA